MGNQKTRYLFVTGGVLSGLGKGITAASIGAILRLRGLNVSIQKCDPYLNVDAGLLNPAEHGECFVTKDGAETDLDLGHYERFLDIELTQAGSTMSGRLFRQLIEDERTGKFRGKTLQLVPHFTNAIQSAILASGEGSDVHIVELGGTVGDIEGLAFLEAIREFAGRVGRENCIFAHVVYVPYIGTSKEFKTKPAQNAVRDLRSWGIMPDLLFARTETSSNGGIIDKLAMFSGLPKEAVVELANARTVYEVPLTLQQKGIDEIIVKRFGLDVPNADMSKWSDLVSLATADCEKDVKIAMVAKYLANEDTYISVVEALKAAAWHQHVNLNLVWIDAEQIEKEGTSILHGYDAVVVPGGFGQRGMEGMIAAARYCMDNQVPYLGLCLGLQMAVVAAARKAGLEDANTGEASVETQHPVIYIMQGQEGKESTGGTLRLGDYPCHLKEGSLAEKVYGAKDVIERHRHRYEVNQQYRDQYESAGLKISGLSPDGKLVEVVEYPDNPYFIATQAHPEFRSRPHRPHPLFSGLVESARR